MITATNSQMIKKKTTSNKILFVKILIRGKENISVHCSKTATSV